jgi:hypothetical protein
LRENGLLLVYHSFSGSHGHGGEEGIGGKERIVVILMMTHNMKMLKGLKRRKRANERRQSFIDTLCGNL